jgi:L-alanine-DL-glutamate epimerase-like enolase superfamily enzyme
LKVTHVRTQPLAVPFVDTHVSSWGQFAVKSTLLIEVFTDEGIVGLGEAPGVPFADVIELVVHEFEQLLIGEDPRHIVAFNQRCIGSQGWHRFRSIANYALGGLDIALWDIVGKCLNQPLHRLLGGAVRDRIDMYGWVPRKERSAMAEDARRFKEQGFSVLYAKVGLGHERDSADLAAIRDAAGYDVELRIDANGAWTPAQAVREIRQLEQYKLGWVEQPVTEDDLDGFDYVHRSVGIPLCIDQGAQTNPLAYRAIARRLADVICLDVHRMGGVLPLKEMAAMAKEANISVCRHAGPEYGISSTAHLHVLATIPNLTSGNQTYGTMIVDDVVQEPTRDFQQGALKVPDAPGIGVTLDPDKVARYAAMYRDLRKNHYRVCPPQAPRTQTN